MINWIVTINRPMYRQVSDVLVPKDKVTEFVTELMSGQDWCDGDSITIEPSNMGYFDG
jgi:hypothetical protein